MFWLRTAVGNPEQHAGGCRYGGKGGSSRCYGRPVNVSGQDGQWYMGKQRKRLRSLPVTKFLHRDPALCCGARRQPKYCRCAGSMAQTMQMTQHAQTDAVFIARRGCTVTVGLDNHGKF
jgi:hypothetical protein